MLKDVRNVLELIVAPECGVPASPPVLFVFFQHCNYKLPTLQNFLPRVTAPCWESLDLAERKGETVPARPDKAGKARMCICSLVKWVWFSRCPETNEKDEIHWPTRQLLSSSCSVPSAAWHCGPYAVPASSPFVFQHPFVKSAKGVPILRDLINEAMDVKLKRQEAQQREADQDDEENSVSGGPGRGPRACTFLISRSPSQAGRVDVGSAGSWSLVLHDCPVLACSSHHASWDTCSFYFSFDVTCYLGKRMLRSEAWFFCVLLGSLGFVLSMQIWHCRTPWQPWESQGERLSSLDLCCKAWLRRGEGEGPLGSDALLSRG